MLNLGVHADASSIDVILNRLRPMQRFVQVEKVGKGVYVSSFEILPADLVGRTVRVSVRASVGGLQDYRILYLYIERKDEIEVTTSTARASPGDAIEYRAFAGVRPSPRRHELGPRCEGPDDWQLGRGDR
jgi:hypothetical protein